MLRPTRRSSLLRSTERSRRCSRRRGTTRGATFSGDWTGCPQKRPTTAWARVPVTLAVIDSGVQATVTDLSGLVLNGFDYYAPERLGKLDDYGHGTNVASILGAHANNNVDIAGYNQTVRILPV